MITPDGHIAIDGNGIFALCFVGFFVVAVLVTALLNSRPQEDTRREITDWRPICNEKQLVKALNKTAHRGRFQPLPHGQVEGQIGYYITDELVQNIQNWDLEYQYELLDAMARTITPTWTFAA